MEMLEYIGAACAIIGSLWLTHKLPGHSYGFVLFLIASLSLALYFFSQKQYGALAMEVVFIYSNMVGIRKWIFNKV
ncbi:hypothetical protein [Thiomicrorhabdus sp.]|uniref:hypothetical protein n=1 Tax=Thiomicrorhabdus sp. TaxID=2039724 RepID=UPI0035665889